MSLCTLGVIKFLNLNDIKDVIQSRLHVLESLSQCGKTSHNSTLILWLIFISSAWYVILRSIIFVIASSTFDANFEN